MKTSFLLALVASSLCTAGCSILGPGEPEPGRVVARPSWTTSPVTTPSDPAGWAAVERIRLEGADPEGQLLTLLQHPAADVRARAAFTAGSLGWTRLERLGLGRTEDDPAELNDPKVSAWREALVVAASDPDPGVRAAAVDALSRLGLDVTSFCAGPIQADPSAEVRVAWLRATHRLGPRPLDEADRDQLAAALEGMLRGLESDDEGWAREAAWSAVFAAQRQGLVGGPAVACLDYAALIADGELDPTTRLFAAAGLRRTMVTAEEHASTDYDVRIPLEIRGLMEAALDDPDWRLVYELVGALEAHGAPQSVDALATVRREHPSPHVRAAAVRALAAIGSSTGDRTHCATEIVGARMDTSETVRVEALKGIARLYGADVDDSVVMAADSESPTTRVGAAEAARYLPAEAGLPILWKLADDPHPKVVATAHSSLVAAIEPTPSDPIEPVLKQRLATLTDNGVRLSLLLDLKPFLTTPQDAALVMTCLGHADEDIGVELTFNALQVLGDIGTPEAMEVLNAALEHPVEWIRWVAWGELRQAGKDVPEPGVAPRRSRLTEVPSGRPVVAFETTKGTLVFELYPEDAPQHVASFLELIERGHYGGLDFHRVVPNFVIQGGCPRGDGNGGGTWLGPADALPGEFNPRPFARGVLGMPRNQNPDSNGSQIFVTHRPTPHLDGRYVVFGALLTGFEVLDAIEVGDGILAARVVEDS